MYRASASLNIFVIIAFLFTETTGGYSFAQTAPSEVLTSSKYEAILPDGRKMLKGHVRPEATPANFKYHAAPGESLNIYLVLPLAPGVDSLLAQQRDPNSPMYHHWLKPGEFAKRFGTPQYIIDKIKSYLIAHNLEFESQSATGNLIRIKAYVPDLEEAFNVEINHYMNPKNRNDFIATSKEPIIDASIADGVVGAVGFDNISKVESLVHRSTKKAAISPQIGTGYNGALMPSDIAKAYNFNGIPSNGPAQNVALFETEPYLASDIATFMSSTYVNLGNVSVSNPCNYADTYTYSSTTPDPPTTFTNPSNQATCSSTNVLQNIIMNNFDGQTSMGNNNQISSGGDEPTADIEELLGLASNAIKNLYVYETDFSNQGWMNGWSQVTTDDIAPVVSCSWGGTESGMAAVVSFDQEIFAQMAAQGQQVFVASGDYGAYELAAGEYTPSQAILQVEEPAAEPNVTGVGISKLSINANGSYNGETASQSSGGGISGIQAIPSYQPEMIRSTVSQYSSAIGTAYNSSMASTQMQMRNVPDIALNGDADTGYDLWINDAWGVYFGSSIAAPVAAALAVFINQGRAALNQTDIGPFGPMNQTFYAIAAQSTSYVNDFHDVWGSGQSNNGGVWINDVESMFYPAVQGYNNSTGLGSLNGLPLYNDLVPPVMPATGYTTYPSSNEITLSWNAPPSTGTTAEWYTVARSTTSGGPYTPIPAATEITSTSYTDTGLTNGTTYYYVVSAGNFGGAGPNSPQFSATPVSAAVPSAPTTITATAGNAQATVAFSGAWGYGSTITNYTVTSTPGSLTATGTGSPITVGELTNGTSYTFTVTATSAIGTSAPSVASNSVIPATIPSAPTTVTATAGNTQATVAFSGASPNGSAIISYTVTSTSGGKAATATGATSPITVTGLTNGDSYAFKVTATNALGTSAASVQSNSVTPGTVTIPSPPTMVMAIAGNAQATVVFSGALTNGSRITSYTVTSTPGSYTATGSASPLTVAGLTNGTTYTFKVTATNAVGTSAPSGASNRATPAIPSAPITYNITTSTGIICAAYPSKECPSSVIPGTTVTFTAVTPAGDNFTGWAVTGSPGGLGCYGERPCNVTITTNTTLTAHFTS